MAKEKQRIPVVLLGVDKTPRGDLGLGLLAELISESTTQKSLTDKGYELKVTGLSDFEGTTDLKELLELKDGAYDTKLKKALAKKKSGCSILERPWTVYKSSAEEYGQFIAESYAPGLVVVDMSHPFDLEKSNVLVNVIKELQISLICPLSRSPAFKEKCASLLGPCFRSFVKFPSPKRLAYSMVEAFEANPNRFAVADSRLIGRILGLAVKEEEVDLWMPLPDVVYPPTARLSIEKKKEIIRGLIMDPVMAIARMKEGRAMECVAAMSHLVGIGPHLSSSIIVAPTTQFQHDGGFGPFFASMGAIKSLVQGALEAFSLERIQDLGCYLECLYSFLLSPVRAYEIATLFELEGGIELLFKRHKFNSILYHSDGIVREFARQCLSLLIDRKFLKRKCETCGRQERSLGEYDCCSECRLAAYCSGACQMKDWQRKHATDCRPPRLEPETLLPV